MRCYIVIVGNSRKFAGTQADCRTTRDELMTAEGAAGRVVKKKDVMIEEIDVPVDKNGLIAYLNELVRGPV